MINPLTGYWNNSGIAEGDTVLIHSSLARTLRFLATRGVKPEAGLVIESILEQIGKDGTLIFPLFNFDFPETKFFSIIDTPSQMGILSEFVRLNYEGVRTGHPIYSFYAIGQNSQEFEAIDNVSGYGSDSPFAKIIQMKGKIAVIDLEDQNSMTTYHHVEEMMNVDYRFHKTFEGLYENRAGKSQLKSYTLFVRDIDQGVTTDINRMGEILWNEGLYSGNRPGVANGMRTIFANQLFERTAREISEGRALDTLYSINKV